MDFGRGILDSLQETLLRMPEQSVQVYNSFVPNEEVFSANWPKEQSLLRSIFRGNLVLRKGRKSEGLSHVAQKVSWFGGALYFRSGHTEVRMAGETSETFREEIRQDERTRYFTPGVIGSAVLPSYNLNFAFPSRIPRTPRDRESDHTPIEIPIVVHRKSPPEGLFGGHTATEMRRKCELYAREFFDEYCIAQENNAGKRVFFEVDLCLSTRVSLDFLDMLLQELCKATVGLPKDVPQLLRRMFFSNIRRDFIERLRIRNCASFLKLIDAPCIFLDEADRPHFLGIHAATRKTLGIEEALFEIFRNKSVSEDELKSHLVLDNKDIWLLQRLFSQDTDDLLHRFPPMEDLSVPTFYCMHDILRAIHEERKCCLGQMKQQLLSIRRESMGVTQTRSFQPVLRSQALPLSDSHCLFACAKLLLTPWRLPQINTLVAFMHNGDLLAPVLQRITGIGRLIIADPASPNSWKFLHLDSDYALVVDLLDCTDEKNFLCSFIDIVSDMPFSAEAILTPLHIRRKGKDETTIFAGLPVYALSEAIVESTGSQEMSSKEDFEWGHVSSNDQANQKRAYPQPSVHYSDIEMSAEFWHNASCLGIVSPFRTGREERNVLFYENNERIIENQRTRAFLEDFVADFVTDELNLKIDVVLHPTHSVGSFLAQLVASLVPAVPLILPLRQIEYGGKIELTHRDYERFRSEIEEMRNATHRPVLRALIVDDSILTGSSIFTMLGIADSLGLRSKGVLVLLSRLSPEVSAAFESLPLTFAYLYRLHMPVLAQSQSPDSRMTEWCARLEVNRESYCAELWNRHIRQQPDGSYFLGEQDAIDNAQPLYLPPRSLFWETCKPKSFKRYQLRQIIDGLILHDDSRVLSFYARLAILYNFHEGLVEEDIFWEFNDALLAHALSTNDRNVESNFLRKEIYLLAFSRHLDAAHVEKRYIELCVRTIDGGIHQGRWNIFPHLMADAIIAPAIRGSSAFLTPCLKLLSQVAPRAFETPSIEEDINLSPAWRVLSAFAWAVGILCQTRDKALSLEYNDAIVMTARALEGHTEFGLLFVDVCRPLLKMEPKLRNKVGIAQWRLQVRFLDALRGNDLSSLAMRKYLSDAPGYTCTLKSVLMISSADTVLLLAANKSDERLFVRAYGNRGSVLPNQELTSKDFNDGIFSDTVRTRMKNGLFFSSDSEVDTGAVDKFCAFLSHNLVLGAAVPPMTKGIGEYYYLVVGYSEVSLDREKFIKTAHWYLRECADFLRDILPSIHERHIVSGTAWNAVLQSIGALHPLRAEGNARKKLLQEAMNSLHLAELLRKAIGITRQEAVSVRGIVERVRAACNELQQRVARQASKFKECDDVAMLTSLDSWPVTVRTSDQDLTETDVLFSCYDTILEFVLLECLCNALAHYEESIWIDLECHNISAYSASGSAEKAVHAPGADLFLRLRVSNDCQREMKIAPGTGIAACKAAAGAVNGEFDSDYSELEGTWIATLDLPGYRVPSELRDWLHDVF
jgi:adenine/guanine phosphoribosyltransferase-like PRPP-binding protein